MIQKQQSPKKPLKKIILYVWKCFFLLISCHVHHPHIFFHLSRTTLGRNSSTGVHTYVMQHVAMRNMFKQRLCQATTSSQGASISWSISLIPLREARGNVRSILNMAPLSKLTSKWKYSHLRVWMGSFSSGPSNKWLHVNRGRVVVAERRRCRWMLSVKASDHWLHQSPYYSALNRITRR